MFCTQCGHIIPDTETICQNCNHPLTVKATVAPDSVRPQEFSLLPENPALTPKKSRIGLVVGIVAGVLLLAGAAVLSGCFPSSDNDRDDTGDSVEGIWVNEDKGEILRFRTSGRVTFYNAFDELRGEYEYDAKTEEGVLTLDDEDYDFTVDDDELDVDDMGIFDKEDDDFDIEGFIEEIAESTTVEQTETDPTMPPTVETVEQSTETQQTTMTVTDQTLTLTFSFGERTGTYTGTLVDGLPHGSGSYTAYNSDGVAWTYHGQWEQGHCTGEGTTIWEDGHVEGGIYSNDMLNGQGYSAYQDRLIHEGEYLNGEFHNQGTLYNYSSGEIIYTGSFNSGYIKETAENRLARVGAFKDQSIPSSVNELYDACASNTSIRSEISGTVFYVWQDDEYVYFQIYDNGVESRDTVISFEYYLSEGETVPYEGQSVTVWGTTEYLESYTTEDGTEMTVPMIMAWNVE